MSDDSISLDPRNLIVNYIPTPVTDSVLRSLFSPFGEIETARVIVDKNTGHPKGYGFVKFVTVESALMAMEKMNGFELQNKRLKVTTARGPTASVGNPAFGPTSMAPFAANPSQGLMPAPISGAPVHSATPNITPPQSNQPPAQAQSAMMQPVYPQTYPGFMPGYPQPMMMPYPCYFTDPTGRPVPMMPMMNMPMMTPMGMTMAPGMPMGMMPGAMPGAMPTSFGSPMVAQTAEQLPNFPQPEEVKAIPTDAEQMAGKGSMNMTLMGVSNLGTPQGSIDAKAGVANQSIQRTR